MKKILLVFCLLFTFSVLLNDKLDTTNHNNKTEYYIDYDNDDLPELVNL